MPTYRPSSRSAAASDYDEMLQRKRYEEQMMRGEPGFVCVLGWVTGEAGLNSG